MESASAAWVFLTIVEEDLKRVDVEHLLYKYERAMSIRFAPDKVQQIWGSGIQLTHTNLYRSTQMHLMQMKYVGNLSLYRPNFSICTR